MQLWVGKILTLRPASWVGVLAISMALVGFARVAVAQETAEPSEEDLIAAAFEVQ